MPLQLLNVKTDHHKYWLSLALLSIKILSRFAWLTLISDAVWMPIFETETCFCENRLFQEIKKLLLFVLMMHTSLKENMWKVLWKSNFESLQKSPKKKVYGVVNSLIIY